MKFIASTLLALVLSGFALAEQPTQGPAEAAAKKDYETSSAIVERVFRAEEDGFVYVSYLVTWRGYKVIIPDPIHQSDYSVGDTVTFLAMTHDMTSRSDPKSRKLLAFTLIQPGPDCVPGSRNLPKCR